MPLVKSVVNGTISTLIHICCRVDRSPLTAVPAQGPLIIIANHINFLEAPILYTSLLPRPITGFGKAEFWSRPATRFLFTLWDLIPLHRGEADVEAMRRGLQALQAERIMAVAPEGTRSYHGRMQKAHPGVVILGLRSGAPFIPIAHYGGEKFSHNIKRLRRTDFHIVVGRPFYLDAQGQRVTQELRQRMVDEMMGQIAAMLPEAYRGYYADMADTPPQYLRFV